MATEVAIATAVVFCLGTLVECFRIIENIDLIRLLKPNGGVPLWKQTTDLCMQQV